MVEKKPSISHRASFGSAVSAQLDSQLAVSALIVEKLLESTTTCDNMKTPKDMTLFRSRDNCATERKSCRSELELS